MSLRDLFGRSEPHPGSLPSFVREVRDVDGVRIVRLRGAVGREIAKEANEFLDAAERAPDPFEHSVLFDFSGTTGADFSTVAYLVEATKKRLGKHSRLGIINPPEELVAEIEIARLTDLLTVYPTEQAAMSALRLKA